MTNRKDRSYYKSKQVYYRPKYYKALKLIAWAFILFAVFCIMALCGARV